MPHRSIRKIAAGLLMIVLGAGQLFGFSTFDKRWGAIVGYAFGKEFGFIHREITLKAMEPLQIKEKFQQKIAYWNWRPDWDETKKMPPDFLPNQCYKPEHHFDRNEIAVSFDKHAEAFTRAAKYVGEQRAIVVAGLKKEQGKDVGDALQATGRAFHALQDFFSHSNLIDLPEADFGVIKKALAGASSPPGDLKITGYDIRAGGAKIGEPFAHDVFSKDEQEKNDEAQKPIEPASAFYDKNNPGKTKFEGARDAAADYSRQWLEGVRNEVGPAAWARLNDDGIEPAISDEGCANKTPAASLDTSNWLYFT